MFVGIAMAPVSISLLVVMRPLALVTGLGDLHHVHVEIIAWVGWADDLRAGWYNIFVVLDFVIAFL